jgi:mRNA-degrading endonuclease RelE of RelBE toxin-antitoxin system
MTKLLRKAFQKAAAVLPEYEQDELARRLLSAIESDEKRWDMLFADSATKLERLADRALDNIKRLAREAYKRFQQNPRHPGLSFKRVHSNRPIYSVRIGVGYRALGVIADGGDIIWFWIGSHAEYDKMI